jgi:3-hydroxyacyl-CoA dehydrogenase
MAVRVQGALLAEAFRLVGEGYISAEDLDHTRTTHRKKTTPEQNKKERQHGT